MLITQYELNLDRLRKARKKVYFSLFSHVLNTVDINSII